MRTNLYRGNYYERKRFWSKLVKCKMQEQMRKSPKFPMGELLSLAQSLIVSSLHSRSAAIIASASGMVHNGLVVAPLSK